MILKEELFSIIDRVVLDYLKEKVDFMIVINEFLKNDIHKTIDAFTTEYFYNFYSSLNWQDFKGLEIFFLLDSKFFLSSPEVLRENKVLGIKFFIDGTFSSSTAWEIADKKNLFLDEKEFFEVLKLIGTKFTDLSYIYLAFHCVGKFAFKFLSKEIATKVLSHKNTILRVEHCCSIEKEDLMNLVELIDTYKSYGRVFLVLNPEPISYPIQELYKLRKYFYVCYASDTPIYSLDLKNSIINILGDNYEREFKFKIARDIFRFNKLLFRR
ncbi:MAG: hypothetical protein RMJ51_06650 [Candidatus Calescibacterium sp.]|nr:hypothetical protein [Candidatus Calescibacterium sp.]MCX7758401.1 hypothetical protein [bacterium]MDW8195895.1 hypothetical protein [Candidatus Calescibacterium sp.]